MLGTMRSFNKSVFSKLLLLPIVVSFVIWGIGDMLRASGPTFAAQVGHDTISVGEFEQQRGQMARQLQNMGISQLPPGKLEEMVIRQLVQEKLTLLTMQEMGLYVNDTLAGKSIANMKEFADDNGKFSGQKFTSLLARQHLPESVFVNALKREIAGKFLIESMSMKDAAVPPSVLALEAMTNGETRDAVLFTVPARASSSEADDAKLQQYYNEHKDTDYARAETRDLEYVVLTPAQIDAAIEKSITPAMLAEAAKEHPNQNDVQLRVELVKEQRDDALRNLTNTVEDELAAGKTITQAFAKAGIDTQAKTLEHATPELAKTSEDDVTKTVAEQGFSLGQGEISRLIRTKKGTLLMVSVKKINAASPKPFDEVKGDVREKFLKMQAQEDAHSKAQTVKDALAKAPNWQAVAEDQHLSTRVVSRLARPTSPKETDGVPAALQQALFEHKIGEVAGPLTLPNGDQLMALVTASHFPTINEAAAEKPSKASAQITSNLAGDIENRAYQSFADRYKVVVNPAILSRSKGSE